jgi:hypothetical protein
MKTKCVCALFILLLFFSFNLAAAERGRVERESMKTEYSKSRFVDRFSNSTIATNPTPAPSGAGDGITPPGRPGTGDALGPIGDAVWLVLLLGLGYGIYLFAQKRKPISF